MTSERHRHEIEHGKFLASDPLKHWSHASWAGQERVARRAKLFIEKTGIRPGLEVLELGFGLGEFTGRLALSGARVTAVDISPDLKAIAEKAVGHRPNVKLVLGDAETLSDFRDASFDAVVGNSILHHLDAMKTLKSVFRVLKPGGRIAFSEPNMLNPQIALQKNIPWLKKALGDSPDETAFFSWPMRGLLRASGFAEVHVEPFDFLHPALPKGFARRFAPLAEKLEKIPGLRQIAGSLLISAQKP